MCNIRDTIQTTNYKAGFSHSDKDSEVANRRTRVPSNMEEIQETISKDEILSPVSLHCTPKEHMSLKIQADGKDFF